MSHDPANDDVALSVTCPRCDAQPGELCHTSVGLPRAVHARRTSAYLATLDPATHLDDA